MTNTLENFKNKLPKDHVLYTMIIEHEIILETVNAIENSNFNIQKSSSYEEAEIEIINVKEQINKIINAEPHHQREEQVLFIELESKGVMGPPKFMRWEHNELRELKHDIKSFVESEDRSDFDAFKKNVNFAVSELVHMLREHIFKENHVLYPVSLSQINDSSKWNEMKKKCDDIGYCTFTPEYLIVK